MKVNNLKWNVEVEGLSWNVLPKVKAVNLNLHRIHTFYEFGWSVSSLLEVIAQRSQKSKKKGRKQLQ